jgi:hypothetical protein
MPLLLTDEQLLNSADPEAFGIFYARYNARVERSGEADADVEVAYRFGVGHGRPLSTVDPASPLAPRSRR